MRPADLRRLVNSPRVLLAAVIVLFAVATLWVGRQAWAVHQLTRGVGDTWFLDAGGARWFRLDEQRRDVPIDAISPYVQQAFVAVEDHRFFLHPGVDPIGLARAIWANAEGGGRQGGSTITQQLARTLFLSNQKSYVRKAREALLSVLIEIQLTKPQILELYLNRIYLSAGVYGVETMAQRLFEKPARSLTLAESALIAGLARAPAALSPWSNLDRAVARSHVVLERMRDEGFITATQLADAKRASGRIRVRPYRAPSARTHGYAKDYLRQQFRNRFGGDHPPDWQVRTTVVRAIQDAAERAVEDGLRRLDRPELQAALVAVDPATGDVLALVGGRDFATSPFNRATRSRRQPGSAFKPFLYAAALGRGYSPVSVLRGLDAIAPQGPEEWAPRNASGEMPAAMSLRAALLESNNRAAAALQVAVGSRPVLRLASSAGLRGLPDVPSLSLGTGLVTPLDLAAAYAVFPNGGEAVRPRGITSVVDADGSTVLRLPPSRERVLTPTVAYQMVSLLQDVVERGTGANARRLGVRFPAGGKTGTTNEFRDAWFVGFSSSVVAAVWVGFDTPAPIAREGSGSRFALPIWADFMARAARVRRPQPFERPAGLAERTLCRVSYLEPVDGCPVYTEFFKEGDAIPEQLCRLHRGSVRQRVTRTVQGWFSELGRRLKDLVR